MKLFKAIATKIIRGFWWKIFFTIMAISAVLGICTFTYEVDAFGPQKNIQGYVDSRVQNAVCDLGFST